jgi:hypothetical protein
VNISSQYSFRRSRSYFCLVRLYKNFASDLYAWPLSIFMCVKKQEAQPNLFPQVLFRKIQLGFITRPLQPAPLTLKRYFFYGWYVNDYVGLASYLFLSLFCSRPYFLSTSIAAPGTRSNLFYPVRTTPITPFDGRTRLVVRNKLKYFVKTITHSKN